MEQLVNDIAICIALKRNRCSQEQHHIYAESFERIERHGMELANKMETQRQYEKMVEKLADFIKQNPEVVLERKNDNMES